ncbi:MAG: molecular chaperone HtpG [Bacillota bacterium]|nr:molecular chaperone HtpG [Bacillota bacterium]
MAKRKFKAESKRVLDIMINSIYTHKEIFLRELISNASDAIDKIYYKALTDDSLEFDKSNYYIRVKVDKDSRKLIISDTGIGMTKEELVENLGVIAQSGSFNFKNLNKVKDGYDIIGQFGVGFYSSFMVADKVEVHTRALGEEGYMWVSEGADGYTIKNFDKENVGTDIILTIKENTEDDNYDKYLNTNELQQIVKKYSDFIRYPIKMKVNKTRLKEGTEDEYENYAEVETVNSMVPIWKKNKLNLKDEDYENFYSEKHFGFDKPLSHLHVSVDGVIRYNAVLFIPENIPFDYYSKEYEKGLELYSNGVLIMNRCPDLLPDYFSFVKGVVDSEDLTLNLSREVLQKDRQLQFIAKNLRIKIKKELETMMKHDREKYEKFYSSFGRQLKFGIYDEFGRDKDFLKDLLMFYSSKKEKMVSLDEYVESMPEDQNYIYYAAGESKEMLKKLPQTESITDKGYEVLYFTEDVDEFAIKMLGEFKEKEFKSVSSSDIEIDESDDIDDNEADDEIKREIFEYMTKSLSGKISKVKASKRLKNHPVCLSNEGDVSIEMEKVLKNMPNNQNIKADKILEININHKVFESLKNAYTNDKDKLDLYTNLLYNQALLIEGLPLEDPVEFSNNISKIMD